MSSLGCPVVYKRHAVSIVLLCGIIPRWEEYLAWCLCGSKINLFNDFFFLMIVLDKSLEKDALLSVFVFWILLKEVWAVWVSYLVTNQFLVYNWEFKSKISHNVLQFSFACWKVKFKSRQLASKIFVLKEWMLFIERDLDVRLRAAIQNNNFFTLTVGFFPCIDIVEWVVSWELEPLDLVWVLAELFHDSISSRLFLIELEYEFSLFHGLFWDKFECKVRNNDVIFCDWEIMDHSHASDVDIHLVNHSSVFVK